MKLVVIVNVENRANKDKIPHEGDEKTFVIEETQTQSLLL